MCVFLKVSETWAESLNVCQCTFVKSAGKCLVYMLKLSNFWICAEERLVWTRCYSARGARFPGPAGRLPRWCIQVPRQQSQIMPPRGEDLCCAQRSRLQGRRLEGGFQGTKEKGGRWPWNERVFILFLIWTLLDQDWLKVILFCWLLNGLCET